MKNKKLFSDFRNHNSTVTARVVDVMVEVIGKERTGRTAAIVEVRLVLLLPSFAVRVALGRISTVPM